jgi:hypothetical protein
LKLCPLSEAFGVLKEKQETTISSAISPIGLCEILCFEMEAAGAFDDISHLVITDISTAAELMVPQPIDPAPPPYAQLLCEILRPVDCAST